MRSWRVGVLVVLLAGLAVRLPGLAAAPDDFHTMRQYYGQMTAQWIANPSDGVNRSNFETVGVLEVPVQPAFTALVEGVTGTFSWWPARLLSVLCWLAGAAALAALVRARTYHSGAAIGAAAWMVFDPFGFDVSRSVQPDAMMVGLVLVAWWTIHRWQMTPTRRRLIVAALACAGAGVAKPVAVVFLLPALLSGSRLRWKRLVRPVLLAGATLGPVLMFYGVMRARGESLASLADGRFVADLLGRWSFWSAWGHQVLSVASPLGVLIIGITMVSHPPLRRWLGPILFAYVGFGLAFDYRIATDDYYSSILVAIAAVAVGGLIARLQRPWALAFACVPLLGLWQVDTTPSVSASLAADLHRAGELIGPSTHVVTLGPAYGFPIRYYAHVSGPTWPNPGDVELDHLLGRTTPTARERLAQMQRDGAVWFVVAGHPDRSAYGDVLDVLADMPQAGRFGSVTVYSLRPEV